MDTKSLFFGKTKGQVVLVPLSHGFGYDEWSISDNYQDCEVMAGFINSIQSEFKCDYLNVVPALEPDRQRSIYIAFRVR